MGPESSTSQTSRLGWPRSGESQFVGENPKFKEAKRTASWLPHGQSGLERLTL